MADFVFSNQGAGFPISGGNLYGNQIQMNYNGASGSVAILNNTPATGALTLYGDSGTQGGQIDLFGLSYVNDPSAIRFLTKATLAFRLDANQKAYFSGPINTPLTASSLVRTDPSSNLIAYTPPYFNGFYPGSNANYWTTSSATYTDFGITGTIPGITTFQSFGFTLVSGQSSLPAINLSTVYAGVIRVTASAAVAPDNNSGSVAYGLRLVELGGTVLDLWGSEWTTNISVSQFQYTLQGYFNVAAGASYTFKVQGKTSSGPLIIGGNATDSQLAFKLEYVS